MENEGRMVRKESGSVEPILIIYSAQGERHSVDQKVYEEVLKKMTENGLITETGKKLMEEE
jgi:hypothetical protein